MEGTWGAALGVVGFSCLFGFAFVFVFVLMVNLAILMYDQRKAERAVRDKLNELVKVCYVCRDYPYP